MNHSVPKHTLQARPYQRGAGLVEVLVTLVVMGVGLLGIASLYVTTLQAKSTSLSRTRAVYLANDMADRIRANPTAGASYVLASGTSTTATNCSSANCNPQQIAAADLDQWNSQITSATTGLPGTVTRSISRVAATTTTPQVFTIQLTWTEVNSGTLSYVLPLQLCDSSVTTTCR